MPSPVTVTGKVGPGLTATTQLLPDVANLNINFNNKVLSLIGQNPQIYKEYDINAASTMTVTISGGNYTVTIS
jgi:hypothetical protein